jgi:glycosyltransferase involved in cell wall biosynthesis
MPTILEKINVKLLIAGEFWYDKESYLKLIEELQIESHVIIHDRYIPNEEIPYYFTSANVLVAPYKSVTGSGIIQMAIGAGIPVITTDVGNLQEIIEDGVTGFIVQPEDSNALADAVLRYFNDCEESNFKSNMKRIRYKYSWDYLVEKIQSFVGV